MKVIIVGAGKIGTNLAKSLAQENNEVYLIEQDEHIADKSIEKLDVKVIIGNGADPDVLKRAQVQDAKLVLAVTRSDETNLVVCSLAGLFGAEKRIARVRNVSLSETIKKSGYEQFKVDEIINPELVAAKAIEKIIQAPGSSEVADFVEGKILLRAFDISTASPLCGYKIEDFRDEDFPWPFLIVSLVRDNNVIIPKGDTVIQAEDHIYVLLPSNSLGEFLMFVNPDVKLAKKIVIYGAGITGMHLAVDLSEKIDDILLVEDDDEKARAVAGKLEFARVINGSAAEGDILKECGIEAADVFIAASDNDHSNLVSAVLAKKMGAKKTIIITQNQEYMPIINALDIDAIINPHYLAAEQILHLVRGKGLSSVTKLLEGEIEVLEFVPEEKSLITKDILKNTRFPKDAIVGAVYSESGVVLARGDVQIHAGEKVIVFCHERAAKKVQKLFTKK